MPGAQVVCPGCGHPAREHGHDVGCVHGWVYGADGVAASDGCRCEWAHVHYSPNTAPGEVER